MKKMMMMAAMALFCIGISAQCPEKKKCDKTKTEQCCKKKKGDCCKKKKGDCCKKKGSCKKKAQAENGDK